MTVGPYDRYMTMRIGAGAVTEKLERLQFNAMQCRALADSAITDEARKVLLSMAVDYDDRATTLQVNDTGHCRSHR